MKKCSAFTKRVLTGAFLGLIFGILCFAGFSSNPNLPAEISQYQAWSIKNPMLWMLAINRLTIGFVVALAGTITKHPVFGFKFYPALRGLCLGLLLSFSMALGSSMGGEHELAKQAFWMVLLFGGVIGIIIDSIISKLFGQGKELLDY